MTKEERLAQLQLEMERDPTLPLQESNLVFGEGSPDCTVLFIGEAPGVNENTQRRPFVGRAGKLLNELIAMVGWKREDMYITNIVKRRPPENRDPLPEEIAAYKPYLAEQIEILDPPIIATLGRFSMNYFLPHAKISNDRGKVFKADERKIFPLYHPAAALRSTTMLQELKKDFTTLSNVVSGKSTKSPILPEARPTQPKPPQQSLF